MIQIIKDITTACLLFAGLYFCLSTVIGIIRLPDFLSRCHASGTSETIGLLLTCLAFVVQCGFDPLSLKIMILFLIVCMCNPIGSHILAKTAYENGFPIILYEKKED